jgi:hypothetical protein
VTARAVKVGIISKASHANSHAAALRKLGYEVVILGSRPSAIPASIDILVCRKASSSHRGSDLAMEAKHRGRKVIVANGVNEIVSQIQALVGGEGLSAPSEKIPAITNSADSVRVLSEALGVYGHLLHASAAGPVVEALARLRGEVGAQGLALWKQALGICRQESVRRWTLAGLEDPDAGVRVWNNPPRGGVRQVGLLVTDPKALDLVLSSMQLCQTEEEAIKLRPPHRSTVRRRAKKAEAPAPVRSAHHKRAQKAKAPATPATPAAPKVTPMDPPARYAPPTPGPSPEGSPPTSEPAPWDGQLVSAIGLLLAEMKAVGVQSVTVQEDGSVSFRRVMVTEGTLKVDSHG